MLTPEDIAAIRERAEKATAGPWETLADEGEYDFWGSVKGPDYGVCHDVQIGYDALFIANARQDIPALLAHVEEATEIIRAASEYVIDPDAPTPMCINAVYTTPKTATKQLEDIIAAIKKTKELASRIRTFLHL